MIEGRLLDGDLVSTHGRVYEVITILHDGNDESHAVLRAHPNDQGYDPIVINMTELRAWGSRIYKYPELPEPRYSCQLSRPGDNYYFAETVTNARAYDHPRIRPIIKWTPSWVTP